MSAQNPLPRLRGRGQGEGGSSKLLASKSDVSRSEICRALHRGRHCCPRRLDMHANRENLGDDSCPWGVAAAASERPCCGDPVRCASFVGSSHTICTSGASVRLGRQWISAARQGVGMQVEAKNSAGDGCAQDVVVVAGGPSFFSHPMGQGESAGTPDSAAVQPPFSCCRPIWRFPVCFFLLHFSPSFNDGG